MHTEAKTTQEHLKDAMLSLAAAALASRSGPTFAEHIAGMAREVNGLLGVEWVDDEYRDDDAVATDIVAKFEEDFGW